MTTPTEYDRQHHPSRRASDLHRQFNWNMMAVVLALSINLGSIIWFAATLNAIQRQQSLDVAELKAGVSNLTVQSSNNSVRIGVLESKVDDVREAQRRGQ